MRRLSHGALIGFLTVSAIWFVWSLIGPVPLPIFIALFAAAMFQFGWIGSNFNAISMEPLGHIAGTAVVGAGLHADARRRHDRRDHRPVLRRHGDAAGGRLLRRGARSAC